MSDKIELTKVDNGYIVKTGEVWSGRTMVFEELDDVFGYLLRRFEGKGEVIVKRDEADQ